MNLKEKYLSSAFVLLASTVVVKIVGAIYKIPLTTFIGAVGRGYFAFAYNLIMPIHAITMGSLPVALSKLVSSNYSKNNYQKVAQYKKASKGLFSIFGFAGMALVLLLSFPYSYYIANAPKSIYTILAISPSILFSCISASYRGYYEGKLNMIPTAVSQSLEAILKMVFGLLLAKFVMKNLYMEYEYYGTVFGNNVSSPEMALSIIYPFSSAGAMLGVTFGSAFSYVYLYLYSLFHQSKVINVQNTKSAKKELLSFSFPIMFSTGVQSLFQFLDTTSIKFTLDKVDTQLIKNQLSLALSKATILDSDIRTYAYGILSTALDFKNLVPGVTMALGVCAIPIISSSFESKNKIQLTYVSNSIFKYTFLLSSFGGIILYYCADEMLTFLYGSSLDIAVGALDLVKYFGLTIPVYSMAGIFVCTVQAVGIPEKSIMSYIVCGIVRVMLNFILIQNEKLILFGSIISGAVGYLILSLWNLIIYIKKTNIKFDILKSFVMPLCVFISMIVLNKYLDLSGYFHYNLLIMMLLKGIFLSIIYCILCFLCGLLNFSQIFRYFSHKKIAQTLANTE